MEEALQNLGEHSYKRLPETTKKKGWDMALAMRGARAVMYSGGQDGVLLRYEVFLIKRHDGRKIAGVEIPPGEYFPGEESFGSWAWAYSATERGLKAATKRFEELEAGMKEKTEEQ